MILTCPACDARYTVAAHDVPPGGRTVRCAACAHSWRAEPEGDVLPLGDVVNAFGGPEPAFAGAAAAVATASTAAPLPRQFRAQAKAQRATREAMAAGVVWAVLGAGLLTIVGAAALFRVQVVRIVPAAAGAYAAVHLPVNPTGLTLEAVQGGPGLKEGRAVMIVSGVERNIEAEGRPAYPLKVQLIDKAGRAVATQAVPAPGGPIAPGETRGFKATFENPPIDAAEFQVDFDLARPAAAPKAAHAAAPAPQLRAAHLAPEPVVVHEAAAVPADSPYALPAVAAHNADHDTGHHP